MTLEDEKRSDVSTLLQATGADMQAGDDVDDEEEAAFLQDALGQESQVGTPDAAEDRTDMTQNVQQKAADRETVIKKVREASNPDEEEAILDIAVEAGIITEDEKAEILEEVNSDTSEDDDAELEEPETNERGELAGDDRLEVEKKADVELSPFKRSIVRRMPQRARNRAVSEKKREQEPESDQTQYDEVLQKASEDEKTLRDTLPMGTDDSDHFDDVEQKSDDEDSSTVGDLIRGLMS